MSKMAPSVKPLIHKIYGLSKLLRRRRMRHFAAEFAISSSTTVLDVGGSQTTWIDVSPLPEVTIVNPRPPETWAPNLGLTFTLGDGTALNHAAGAFDIAFSNSVIEHLGAWQRQVAFATELRRVGKSYYVQTPARSFPIEPHFLALFIHWLPARWRRQVLKLTPWALITRPSSDYLGRIVEEIRLLSLREFRQLFPDARIERERILGLTKSYIAIKHGD